MKWLQGGNLPSQACVLQCSSTVSSVSLTLHMPLLASSNVFVLCFFLLPFPQFLEHSPTTQVLHSQSTGVPKSKSIYDVSCIRLHSCVRLNIYDGLVILGNNNCLVNNGLL